MKLSKAANERLWAALLKEALIEDCIGELAELGQETEKYNFSDKFEKNIKKIKHRINTKAAVKKTVKIFVKIAATAAVLMGVVFGGLLTQPEVYAAVQNVLRNITSQYDNYRYQGENEKTEFDKGKELGYVPEGFELRSAYYSYNDVILTYEGENGNYIYFEYGLSENSSIYVDNEHHNMKEINRDGQTYYYYEASEDDLSSIIWYEDGYYFSIDAQLSESEFVKIAENIKS